jgi:hypothetical protein
MKATYKLELEQQQRRLGLSHNQLNRLDRKHNNINLIKKLQSLEPVASAPAPPPENTGFYGILTITNEKQAGTPTVPLKARLYYGSTPLTEDVNVGYPDTENLEVVIADRLPNPSSTLVLRLIYAPGFGITSADLNGYYGFTPTNTTTNPLEEYNYLDMLVDSGEIAGGELSIELVSTAPE